MSKQITEDYCSFETAKLLKEKGFPQQEYINTFPYYTPNGSLYFGDINKVRQRCYAEAIAPSQSLALKWLSEVHNIVIEISMEDYVTSKNGELQVWYSYTIWTFIRHLGETGLTDARYDDRAFWQENVKVGQSFEEACEAALLYVLKNLI